MKINILKKEKTKYIIIKTKNSFSQKIYLKEKIKLDQEKNIEEKINFYLKSKTIIILHDKEIFIHRLKIDENQNIKQIKNESLKRVLEFIPFSAEEILFEIEKIKKDEVIFYGIEKKKFEEEFYFLKKENYQNIISIYPQSRLIFETIKDQIKEKENIVFIKKNKENNLFDIYFFDYFGPLLVLSDKKDDDIRKIIDFFEEEYQKKIDKIITEKPIENKFLIPIINFQEILLKKFKKEEIKEEDDYIFYISYKILEKNIFYNFIIDQSKNQENKKINYFFIIFSILIFVFIFFFIFFFIFLKNKKNRNLSEKNINKKIENKINKNFLSPTPNIIFDKKQIKIEILNGSGIPGQAQKMADYLKEKGYENIKTGNAENYTYEKLNIFIKKDLEKFEEILKNEIEKDYPEASFSNTLDKEYNFDVKIIIGK